MRWIDNTQNWSARAELNFIAIEQSSWFSDSLTIDQGAVKAFQIVDEKLIVGSPNLRMTARHNGRIPLD